MMRKTTQALCVALIGVGVTAAGTAGADTGTVTGNPTDLALTIYGNGLTLVKDQRQLDMPRGVSRISIAGVSPQMIADSLDLRYGQGLRILTRTLRPPNLNTRSLLEAYAGKTVQLIRTHPQTGVETTLDATLVSVHSGIIARIGGRLVSNPAGTWSFPDIPGHLRAKPALALALESAEPGPRALGLHYLTGGLSWHPAYTATWDKSKKTLRIAAWASLKNSSGIDYETARVQVVAGQVRRVTQAPRPSPRGAVRMMKTEAAMADSAPPRREALAGYHLYTLPQPVNLRQGEAVQAVLLKPFSVPAKRELVSEGHPAVYGRVRGGTSQPTHPTIRLSFKNETSANGQPLPTGTLRLYGADSRGESQFLGEDRVGDVPVGGPATLNAGRAFDVTVRRNQTDFKREDRSRFEAAFEIELRNGGAAMAAVTIIETVPGDWQMIDTDQPSRRENNQAVWRIEVPAKGRVLFKYRVRVRT